MKLLIRRPFKSRFYLGKNLHQPQELAGVQLGFEAGRNGSCFFTLLVLKTAGIDLSNQQRSQKIEQVC